MLIKINPLAGHVPHSISNANSEKELEFSFFNGSYAIGVPGLPPLIGLEATSTDVLGWMKYTPLNVRANFGVNKVSFKTDRKNVVLAITPPGKEQIIIESSDDYIFEGNDLVNALELGGEHVSFRSTNPDGSYFFSKTPEYFINGSPGNEVYQPIVSNDPHIIDYALDSAGSIDFQNLYIVDTVNGGWDNVQPALPSQAIQNQNISIQSLRFHLNICNNGRKISVYKNDVDLLNEYYYKEADSKWYADPKKYKKYNTTIVTGGSSVFTTFTSQKVDGNQHISYPPPRSAYYSMVMNSAGSNVLANLDGIDLSLEELNKGAKFGLYNKFTETIAQILPVASGPSTVEETVDDVPFSDIDITGLGLVPVQEATPTAEVDLALEAPLNVYLQEYSTGGFAVEFKDKEKLLNRYYYKDDVWYVHPDFYNAYADVYHPNDYMLVKFTSRAADGLQPGTHTMEANTPNTLNWFTGDQFDFPSTHIREKADEWTFSVAGTLGGVPLVAPLMPTKEEPVEPEILYPYNRGHWGGDEVWIKYGTKPNYNQFHYLNPNEIQSIQVKVEKKENNQAAKITIQNYETGEVYNEYYYKQYQYSASPEKHKLYFIPALADKTVRVHFACVNEGGGGDMQAEMKLDVSAVSAKYSEIVWVTNEYSWTMDQFVTVPFTALLGEFWFNWDGINGTDPLVSALGPKQIEGNNKSLMIHHTGDNLDFKIMKPLDPTNTSNIINETKHYVQALTTLRLNRETEKFDWYASTSSVRLDGGDITEVYFESDLGANAIMNFTESIPDFGFELASGQYYNNNNQPDAGQRESNILIGLENYENEQSTSLNVMGKKYKLPVRFVNGYMKFSGASAEETSGVLYEELDRTNLESLLTASPKSVGTFTVDKLDIDAQMYTDGALVVTLSQPLSSGVSTRFNTYYFHPTTGWLVNVNDAVNGYYQYNSIVSSGSTITMTFKMKNPNGTLNENGKFHLNQGSIISSGQTMGLTTSWFLDDIYKFEFKNGSSLIAAFENKNMLLGR